MWHAACCIRIISPKSKCKLTVNKSLLSASSQASKSAQRRLLLPPQQTTQIDWASKGAARSPPPHPLAAPQQNLANDRKLTPAQAMLLPLLLLHLEPASGVSLSQVFASFGHCRFSSSAPWAFSMAHNLLIDRWVRQPEQAARSTLCLLAMTKRASPWQHSLHTLCGSAG